MAEVEYKKNVDGTFALWACGQPKLSKDVLTMQAAQLTANISALTGISGLTKEEAQLVSQIVQAQSDLMKKPDFTWSEIVAKFKKPMDDQKLAIDAALQSTVITEPK